MQIVLILLVLLCKAFTSGHIVTEHEKKGLISYGELYDPVKYPYIVGLLILTPKRRYNVCTGTLISPLFVLTAAHCTYEIKTSDIKVFHGMISSKSVFRKLQSIHTHSKYSPITFTSDISLLKLRSPFNITNYMTLSGHPKNFHNDSELNCEIIGFGMTENGKNFESEGYVTNARVKYGPTACKLPFNSYIKLTWPEFLCSEPNRQMICPGDSGGPMICNGSQYGIASHAYNYEDIRGEVGCGDIHVQTRHVFIYVYRHWINNTMIQNTGNFLSLWRDVYTYNFTVLCFTVLLRCFIEM